MFLPQKIIIKMWSIIKKMRFIMSQFICAVLVETLGIMDGSPQFSSFA